MRKVVLILVVLISTSLGAPLALAEEGPTEIFVGCGTGLFSRSRCRATRTDCPRTHRARRSGASAIHAKPLQNKAGMVPEAFVDASVRFIERWKQVRR